jgi:cytochrome c oxidase assembly protein subunit 15
MDAPAQSLVDFSPSLKLALLALVIAALPLSWWWVRQRGANTHARLAALVAITLFITFDLIVVGAFTRLSDSGLGCPDWPGCYGEASPLGARDEIHAAQAAAPGGPVSWSKAWIEMVHRYIAMTVGVLAIVIAGVSWLQRQRLPYGAGWPLFTLAWVIVQGLFGKYTVTLKLYPLVVTAHLLGGVLLLALLARQHAGLSQGPVSLSAATRRLAGVALAALLLQIALGGWVSSNYAVLACSGFPACNGQWWPDMDFASGFTLLRGLGESGPGGARTLAALVAVHMAHRLMAVVAVVLLLALAWQLRLERDGAAGRFGLGLALVLAVQVATGLSNVVLGWPLVAALGHSAGAAALALLMVLLLARSAAFGTVKAAPAMAWAA